MGAATGFSITGISVIGILATGILATGFFFNKNLFFRLISKLDFLGVIKIVMLFL